MYLPLLWNRNWQTEAHYHLFLLIKVLLEQSYAHLFSRLEKKSKWKHINMGTNGKIWVGSLFCQKKKKKELFCADNDYVKFFKICNMEPA